MKTKLLFTALGFFIFTFVVVRAASAAFPDFDGDGTIGGGDFAILKENFGLSNPQNGNANGDSAVDVLDLALLMIHWGESEEPGERTWEPVGSGGFDGVNSVVVSPFDANRILIGTDGGMALSTDGGASWKPAMNGINNTAPFGNSSFAYPLAWDPQNPNIVYTSTGSNGIYKSTDGGQSWSQATRRTPQTYPPILNMVFDPTNSQVFYAVSEDGHLYRSSNGGTSYTTLATLPTFDNRLDYAWTNNSILAVDAAHNKLYSSTSEGLKVSTNSGISFSSVAGPLGSGGAHSVLYVKNFQSGKDAVIVSYDTLFDGNNFVTFEGGVYVLFDGETQWQKRNSGLRVTNTPTPCPNGNGCERKVRYHGLLRVNPVNTAEMYISGVRGNSYPYSPVGMYKSTDYGQNWSLVTRSTTNAANMEFGSVNPGYPNPSSITSLWEFSPMSFDIAKSNGTLYIYGDAFTLLFKSTNGGNSWQQIFSTPVAGKPGFYKNRGVNLTYSFNVGFDPQNANRIYAGYADFGSFTSDDDNVSHKWLLNVWSFVGAAQNQGTPIRVPDMPAGQYAVTASEVNNLIESKVGPFKSDIHTIVTDPTSTNIVFAVAGTPAGSGPPSGVLLRSTDYGDHWEIIGPNYNGFPSNASSNKVAFYRVAIDPRGTPGTRRIFVTVGRDGVYRSENGGASWTKKSNGIPNGEIITDVAVSQSNPDVVYAASGSDYFLFDFDSYINGALSSNLTGHVFKSTDGGESWSKVYNGPANITQLLVDPTNANTVYMGAHKQLGSSTPVVDGGVYKTTNGGGSWQRVFTQMQTDGIAIHPADHNRLFAVVTERYVPSNLENQMKPGVYESTDAGANWNLVTPDVTKDSSHLHSISVSPIAPHYLYVGSESGTWRLQLP